VITALTLVPQISPLTPVTSILPLVFVLGVTAIKEAYEDYVMQLYRVANST
jgi:phospholipid-transporting ATPase